MLLRDNKDSGSLSRCNHSRPRASVQEIIRSVHFTQSAGGATKVRVGEPTVHAFHVTSWGTMLPSTQDSHDNSSSTNSSPKSSFSSINQSRRSSSSSSRGDCLDRHSTTYQALGTVRESRQAFVDTASRGGKQGRQASRVRLK